MPLKKGSSKQTREDNIEEMIKAGHPPKQAVAAGASQSGCTVHYVDAGMDTGEIIAQAAVPVLAGDTPETLHARIQVEEHLLYPAVLRGIHERESATGA